MCEIQEVCQAGRRPRQKHRQQLRRRISSCPRAKAGKWVLTGGHTIQAAFQHCLVGMTGAWLSASTSMMTLLRCAVLTHVLQSMYQVPCVHYSRPCSSIWDHCTSCYWRPSYCFAPFVNRLTHTRAPCTWALQVTSKQRLESYMSHERHLCSS